MRERNLADPDYEPTDEELAEWMRDAFAAAFARKKAAEEKFWDSIRVAREESLARLRAKRTG